MYRFFARLRNVFGGGQAERDLGREINAHLALLQEDYERRGLSPTDARLAARRAYGGVEQTKELHRDARSFRWMGHFAKDVRYGLRNLRRNPGFTTVALLALGLGIGATTAIFSVVNTVLLRPLAYADPDRLVTVLHQGTGPVATANYIDWRDQSHSFEAMGAADAWSANLASSDPADTHSAERLPGLKVTQNLLPLLGVKPLLGRFFLPGEDRVGAEHEVILSHRLWQARFSGNPAILGKQLRLNGEGYTVVGVMPVGFRFAPFWATRTELWVPNAFGNSIHERSGNHLRVFARLKAGTNVTQAQADIAAVTARLEKQFPATNRGVMIRPLKENVVGEIRGPLFMLLGSVAFVLLIACANVAHMLLARNNDRQREIAVRAALGAARSRVVSQFLTESLLLAAGGAAVGLAIAFCGLKILVALAPKYLPRVENLTIDFRVVLFLIAVTCATALLFGLIPALRVTSQNLSNSLKEGGRGDSDSVQRHRLRGFLVASEFALAFVLLIAAGLMIRTFMALQAVDAGFNPHNVLSMVVSVAGSQEEAGTRRAGFYRQVLESIRALPGVESAGAINHLPLAGDLWDRTFTIQGRPEPRPGEAPDAVYRLIMPGYLDTMRIPLRRGRTFSERDDLRAPGVAIINERAAREYWPGQNAVGQRITLSGDKTSTPEWLTIVGVVADVQEADWAAPLSPELYLPALQTREFLGDSEAGASPHTNYITLVVRGDGDPANLAALVKRTVQTFDRNLAISDVTTMDRAIAEATAQPHFEMLLLGTFALVALVLAAVGIYGVISYSVARRTREIGIRISLGASRAEVLRMVMRQGMLQAAGGGAAGLIGAHLLARLLEKMLYGVQPTDPVTFFAVATVLLLAASLAIVVPARRATRIDPMTALRSE
jgi:predicted permease